MIRPTRAIVATSGAAVKSGFVGDGGAMCHARDPDSSGSRRGPVRWKRVYEPCFDLIPVEDAETTDARARFARDVERGRAQMTARIARDNERRATDAAAHR